MPLFGPPDVKKLEEKRNVNGLVKALRHKDPSIRSKAAKALGSVGDAQAVEPLIAALGDAESYVRWQAVEALAALGAKEAVASMAPLLQDEDTQVRWSTIAALGTLGSPQALDPLLAMLDREPVYHKNVVEAVAKLGDARAVPTLADFLTKSLGRVKDDDYDLCSVVAEALGAVGTPGDARAIDALLAMLPAVNYRVQPVVVEALDRLGWQPGQDELAAQYWAAKQDWAQCVALGGVAVPPLLTLLDTYSYAAPAIQALGEIGDARAVDPLMATYRRQHYRTCQPIITALRGFDDPRIPELFVRIIQEHPKSFGDDLAVCQAAVTGLAHYGSAAMPRLIDFLDSGNGSLRQAVVEALGEIGDADAQAALILALEDQAREVRQAAVAALKAQGPAVLDLLLAVLQDKNSRAHQEAAEVLGALGDARAVEPLLALFDRSQGYDRIEAAKSLGLLGDARALDPMLAALGDSNPGVSQAAVEALGQIGDPRIVDPLCAILTGHYANQEKIAKLAHSMDSTLSSVLRSEDSNMRRKAAEVLTQLDDPRVLTACLTALEQEKEPQTLKIVLEYLGNHADPDERITAAIIGQFSSVNSAVSSAAARASVARGAAAVEPLMAVLPQRYLCDLAAWALGEIGDARAVEALCTALQTPDSPARYNAAVALGRIGDARAAEALQAASQDSKLDHRIRAAAQQALAALG